MTVVSIPERLSAREKYSIAESHLAQEAIAALVDGELASGPAARAARHLVGCAQCRMAMQAQREAKEALHESADVAVPGDLLSRLRAIPFTTDVRTDGWLGSLRAGSGELTVDGASGNWAVGLPPGQSSRPAPAGRLRRGLRTLTFGNATTFSGPGSDGSP
jgi:anti-sigma factor RsiW